MPNSEDLLRKIEELRFKLINQSNKNESYKEVLRISQELDKYIAEYQKAVLYG